MSRSVAYRGQPVMVLLIMIAGWFALRIVLWQAPFPDPVASMIEPAARLIAPTLRSVSRVEASAQSAASAVPIAAAPREPLLLGHLKDDRMGGEPKGSSAAWALYAHDPPATAPVPPRVAAGQILLLAAAFSNFEVAPELAALLPQGRAVPAAIPPFPVLAGASAQAPLQRWSGDAWLLLRKDTTTPVTSGRGSYGRSQVGAVLRYRLDPASGHRPAAYVRASAALAGASEPEVAAGLTARPLAAVPIAVAAEVRAARLDGNAEARPAAFAYSEFPPLKLPLGTRGEAYFQGGYVGGSFATAFVDGQVRVDREIARVGPTELRAGGGAWGGAQKHVTRVDIGPSASVSVDTGGAPVRVSADWRFRIAGEANPDSGPALTVSAGF